MVSFVIRNSVKCEKPCQYWPFRVYTPCCHVRPLLCPITQIIWIVRKLNTWNNFWKEGMCCSRRNISRITVGPSTTPKFNSQALIKNYIQFQRRQSNSVVLKTYIFIKNDIYFQNRNRRVDPEWSILTSFLTYYWVPDNKRPHNVQTLIDMFKRHFYSHSCFSDTVKSVITQFQAQGQIFTFMTKPTCRLWIVNLINFL